MSPNENNESLMLPTQQQEDAITTNETSTETAVRPLYSSDCDDRLEMKPTTLLLCGHRFCTDSIEKWFSHSKTCPICRAVQQSAIEEPTDSVEDLPLVNLLNRFLNDLDPEDDDDFFIFSFLEDLRDNYINTLRSRSHEI